MPKCCILQCGWKSFSIPKYENMHGSNVDQTRCSTSHTSSVFCMKNTLIPFNAFILRTFYGSKAFTGMVFGSLFFRKNEFMNYDDNNIQNSHMNNLLHKNVLMLFIRCTLILDALKVPSHLPVGGWNSRSTLNNVHSLHKNFSLSTWWYEHIQQQECIIQILWFHLSDSISWSFHISVVCFLKIFSRNLFRSPN